jgi:hypothetical protein
MKEAEVLGVAGSPWKMYVDPAQDVVCYHNMATGERVFEYDMTDKKLMDITHSNIYAESHTAILAKIEGKHEEITRRVFWVTMRNYVV